MKTENLWNRQWTNTYFTWQVCIWLQLYYYRVLHFRLKYAPQNSWQICSRYLSLQLSQKQVLEVPSVFARHFMLYQQELRSNKTDTHIHAISYIQNWWSSKLYIFLDHKVLAEVGNAKCRGPPPKTLQSSMALPLPSFFGSSGQRL